MCEIIYGPWVQNDLAMPLVQVWGELLFIQDLQLHSKPVHVYSYTQYMNILLLTDYDHVQCSGACNHISLPTTTADSYQWLEDVMSVCFKPVPVISVGVRVAVTYKENTQMYLASHLIYISGDWQPAAFAAYKCWEDKGGRSVLFKLKCLTDLTVFLK